MRYMLWCRPFHVLAARGVSAFVLILSLAAGGCSSGPSVLARVGAESITTADFIAAARAGEGRYRRPPNQAKSLLLEHLIRRKLMLAQARHDPAGVESLVRDQRRRVEAQVLSQALVQQLVPRTAEVSEAEIRQLYEWR